MYMKKNEPRELASVLRGMTECGAAPADLWTRDQPDGDPFVARAAELLEEQEAQIELLARFVDQFGAQLAKGKAGTLLQVPALGRAAHSVSDEKGNDPQSGHDDSASVDDPQAG